MAIKTLSDANPKHVPFLKLQANRIAKRRGYNAATDIIFADVPWPGDVVSHTDYGYRKKSTGEYVSNSYRLKSFGWKNTYYQHAKVVVVLPNALIDRPQTCDLSLVCEHYKG